MTLYRIGRLRGAARWLGNRFGPRALILLYHRVAQLSSDPQLLSVTPGHFAEHLEILRKHGRPMRLQQLAEALRHGNLPNRAVVITFDDGYADNLYSAKPLLERYDVPATVFLATGYIGQERGFYWDELDMLLLQRGTLPARLCLNINQSSCQWELGEAAHYSEEAYQRHRCWNVLEKDDPSPRHSLYRSLCQLLRSLRERERRKALDELLTRVDARPMVRPTHRALSRDEVVRLAEGELVEVGAHTVTHPVLCALPATAQRAEIHGSKRRLQEILGRTVTSFAYPCGSHSDYTAETVAFVREAGFACACANLADLVRRDTDCFQLPRVLVRDCDGETFADKLEVWFRD